MGQKILLSAAGVLFRVSATHVSRRKMIGFYSLPRRRTLLGFDKREAFASGKRAFPRGFP